MSIFKFVSFVVVAFSYLYFRACSLLIKTEVQKKKDMEKSCKSVKFNIVLTVIL